MNFDDDLTVFDVISDPLIGVLRQADRVDLVSFIAILADAMESYVRPVDPDQDACNSSLGKPDCPIKFPATIRITRRLRPMRPMIPARLSKRDR